MIFLAHYRIVWVCLLSGFVWSQLGYSFTPPQAREAVGRLIEHREFVLEKERFYGNWITKRQWDGWFCHSGYEVRGNLEGKIDKVRLIPKPDGSIELRGDVGEVTSSLIAGYQGAASFCYQLRREMGVSTNWAKLKGNLWFLDSGEKTKIKIRVTETVIDTLHFRSEWVPQWFERFVTWVVNKAMAVVWKTRLGERISDKIAEKIEEQIPEP